MNVSQLAVYQLPDEIHTMRKRNTVPFYNRRRELKQRDTSFHTRTVDDASPTPQAPWFPFLNRRTRNATATGSPSTETVTVAGTFFPTSTAVIPPQAITCIDPPLPGLATPQLSRTSTVDPDYTYQEIPADTNVLAKRAADWNRVAYYTSTAPAQATGLTFMANLGDPRESGTFDYAFGNSLSYVMPSGGQVASESLPFDGTLDTSEREIAVFTDQQCDQNCPYWRPNATSHYGWSGSSKAFFIEFQMDHYENEGSDQGLISDAPAWWFLNAAIPRVLQYGNDRNNIPCSCWSTGCGEFDAFEVLGTGEERAKSTLHRQGNLEGGDSNYFKRPVGRTIKFGVVWHYPHITAVVLDNDFDFAASLSDDQIQTLVSYDPNSWVHSQFAIGD
jgi:hypothetical protein